MKIEVPEQYFLNGLLHFFSSLSKGAGMEGLFASLLVRLFVCLFKRDTHWVTDFPYMHINATGLEGQRVILTSDLTNLFHTSVTK